MDYTDEYHKGWGAWAEHFGFSVKREGVHGDYKLPSGWQNGWVHEINPCEGLFVASAWLTTEEKLDYTLHTGRPFIWVFCVDCGDITITRRGKLPEKLGVFTKIIVSDGKPMRLTIPAGNHACFTSVLIFDSWIESFLSSNGFSYPIRVEDAKNWKPSHIDTPRVMMTLEQIRWGVRGDRLPPLAYLCKSIELLCLFAHNKHKEKQERNRRHYVNWDDERKLYRVKEWIDEKALVKLPMEELCRLAEMSESKLRISFKSLYKKTIYCYTREAVMKRAMQLLGDDDLNIKNIANLCGYENPAKFAAAFKDIYGITPSDFRKSFGL